MTSSTISPAMAASHPPDLDERRAWIALAGVPGLGPRRMATLLSRFGSASGVLRAPLDALRGTGMPSNDLARTISRVSPAVGQELEAAATAAGQQLLTPADAGYPPLLRAIPDPPLLLFAVGDIALLAKPAVAIVGSRDHTEYGRQVAAAMGSAAASADIVVVSGMARGLDAIAQAAALDAGGATIGVLGNGVDVVYPRSNHALYRRVIDSGLLLSEYPPGMDPAPGSFPKRNRLISGLARALVVVEAADGSGTMITVATALEQGREVFAVPGPITGATSRGTNRLIRDGATPLLAADDLLAIYGARARTEVSSAPVCTLSAVEARVLAMLSNEPQHVDAIALGAGIAIGDLLGVLLGLELGGLAEQRAGGRYLRR